VRQFVVFCLCFCRNSFAISKTQSKDKCVAFLLKLTLVHGLFFFRRFWKKVRVRKGILGLYCYALHKNTVTWFIIVLRWTICAKSFFCVRMCYNNTLKNFIVNFLYFMNIKEYFFFYGIEMDKLCVTNSGKADSIL